MSSDTKPRAGVEPVKIEPVGVELGEITHSGEPKHGGGVRHGVGAVLVGRYRLEELIGHGGMASVYRATDESLGRTVAIKVFRSDLAEADDLRRQRDEITLLAGMSHPGLVTLFDAVADDKEAGVDQAFLVLEYIEGKDLKEWLSKGPLDARVTAKIGSCVAEALGYIHERGVVHRDVKPGNILMPEQSPGHPELRAKLADFGIARLVDGARITATGSVLGTASYLSPEQAVGKGVGPASDVYSLGLVLLECLTGERAFPGTALESTAARLARDPDVPAWLGPAWSDVLRRMTARAPETRPKASELADELGELITESSSAPTRALPVPAPARPAEELEPTARLAPPRAPAPKAASSIAATQPPPIAPHVPIASPEPIRRPAAARPKAAPAARAPRPKPRRRWSTLALAFIAVAIIALATWFAIVNFALPAESETPAVTYQPVEGDLGTHLEQLQESVAP